MARLITAYYWFVVGLLALVMFPIAAVLWVLTAPWDRRRVVLHQFTNVWAFLYTWLNPVWTVRTRGRDKIDPKQTYVMVANHLSLIDIFAIHRLFRHFKWVSKIEIFQIPCIGWNMRLVRYIPLRRGSRESVLEMFQRCTETLDQGSSVIMFPEGTRSKTGQLKAFKPGAFDLAKRADVPMLPVVVQGTFHALPAKGLQISPARIRVTVLDPVPLQEVRALSIEALSDRVREQIAAFLEDDPWPPPPADR